MARLNYLDPKTAPEGSKELLSKMADLNIFRMLAHSPTVYGPFVRLGNAILFKSKLDPVLREMAIVRVGHLSKASYELFQHERISRQVGMAEEKIAALKDGPEAPVFNETERDVLRFTDDVVKNVRASDEIYEAVARRLDSNQMIELTVTIGYYMMVCRFLETTGVEIEPPGQSEGVKLRKWD
ncbi:MAG: carboxymuconolactone decarboxylase family protein [Deltaproteobacteria bacterium]|nr:carboxymuconolactone decarboxylase family protein [Deltaproteobacteria bacterium]